MSGALTRINARTRRRLTPRILNSTVNVEVPYGEALEGGVIVSNVGATAAVTFALPKSVPGMRVAAVLKANFEIRLDPYLTETVALPSTGVQGAAGAYLTADALGESVNLVCITAGSWDAVGATDGTWTQV